jgi:hypothetical protein
MPDLHRRNPFPSPVAEARARRAAERRARARPVFVDDSGRRHRWARLAAFGAGTVVVVYLAVVALTFVGAPGLRGLEMPGLGEFALPAGSRHADVGASPATHAVPEALAGPPGSGHPNATSSKTSEDGSTEAPAASTTTVSRPGGSTTTAPTTSSTTPTPSSTAPTPNSTVPEPPGGSGPPTTPPGKP